MKINRQFQDLHVPGGGTVDWVLKQHIDRDICLLYHQLANYGSIMGDLYWGSVFALPYWEYLNWIELDAPDRAFIRDGCLVMILTAAWEQIDGAGSYIHQHIGTCRRAVDALLPETADSIKLARAVILALDAAQLQVQPSDELVELTNWVHVSYVRRYFDSISEEFRTNPYYGGRAG